MNGRLLRRRRPVRWTVDDIANECLIIWIDQLPVSPRGALWRESPRLALAELKARQENALRDLLWREDSK